MTEINVPKLHNPRTWISVSDWDQDMVLNHELFSSLQ